MIMNLKGTKTEKNLMEALKGEALAHLKYQWYKSQLSKQSKKYEPLLEEIIHNEKEHGKIWFKLLHNGEMPTNEENMIDAYLGEKHENMEMYPHFSRVAEEEGFIEISQLFHAIAEIEGYHMGEFNNIKNNLDNLQYSEKDMRWKCLNCGYQYNGDIALDECPICKHPQKYFTIIK